MLAWCHENAELVELGVQSVFIAPVHLRTAGDVLAWTPALA